MLNESAPNSADFIIWIDVKIEDSFPDGRMMETFRTLLLFWGEETSVAVLAVMLLLLM